MKISRRVSRTRGRGRLIMYTSRITDGRGKSRFGVLMGNSACSKTSALPPSTSTRALRALHTFRGSKFWFSTKTAFTLLSPSAYQKRIRS